MTRRHAKQTEQHWPQRWARRSNEYTDDLLNGWSVTWGLSAVAQQGPEDGPDLVPDGSTLDQWIGDDYQHPRGVAVGNPTGDQAETGLEGFVAANDPGDGVLLAGFSGPPRNVRGDKANRPAEVAGQPVRLTGGGGVLIEVQEPILEEHYLLAGESFALEDGRTVSPLVLGPRYVPTMQDEVEFTDDHNVKDTTATVATLTLANGPYVPQAASFFYEVYIAEESSQQRPSDFTIAVWANIGGTGMQHIFQHVYPGVIGGQAKAFSRPIQNYTLDVGDVIELRVSAVGSHNQSAPWVRGSVRATALAVRQG